tara:strand:+ start:14 stop:253 length:240 start_codon:yes stop_codon:yes gene_type:complete
MKHYNDQGQLIVVGNFIRVRLPKTDARAKFINVDHIVCVDGEFSKTGHRFIQMSQGQGSIAVLDTMEQILRMLSMAGEQ